MPPVLDALFHLRSHHLLKPLVLGCRIMVTTLQTRAFYDAPGAIRISIPHHVKRDGPIVVAR